MRDVWSFVAVPAVRIWAAAALIVVLALPAALPFFSIQASSSVPACCRRDGSHHCANSSAMAQPLGGSGVAFLTTSHQCPYHKLARIYRTPLQNWSAAAIYAAVVSHPAIHSQTIVSGLVSQGRSHQKRGPPSDISC